jgi:hypothetical protein
MEQDIIPERCGSSSDDGGHMALLPADWKLARCRAQISPRKFLLTTIFL